MDKCSICNDDGKCRNGDIYDCVEYLEEKNGIRKGQWMIDWMRRLKDEEPYESDFVKWSNKVKRNLLSNRKSNSRNK